jgi:phage FluMu gp28-like protein
MEKQSKLEVKGFTPYQKQREWIEGIENPDIKYITLCTGRQIGKTLLAENLILKWALTTNNSTTMVVAPVYSQVRKIFDDLDKVVTPTKLMVRKNRSNYEMVLINGSKIIFRSADRPDTMRGNTLDYLIVDEAGFIADKVWDEVLKPTILVKGKKCLFASTPKGKNWFYTLHLRGLDPSQTQYITFNASSFDNPYINQDDLLEAQRTLPPDIFKQEILGEFVDSGGEVFADIDRFCVLDQYPPKQSGKKYWAGADFGRQNDYSVLTIFDGDGNLVYFYRERQKSWSEIIDTMVKALKHYEASCQVEVNSIGDVLYEQMKKQYNKVEPFVTTNSSKQNIVEDFIYGTNEGLIKLPTERLNFDLYNELKTFTYDYSIKSRKVTYKALDGAHDDIIMSLCIAYNTLKERKSKGQYHIY